MISLLIPEISLTDRSNKKYIFVVWAFTLRLVKKARFQTRCTKARCTGRTRRPAFFWRKKDVAHGT